jgi:hypothetical protein
MTAIELTYEIIVIISLVGAEGDEGGGENEIGRQASKQAQYALFIELHSFSDCLKAIYYDF